MLGKQSARLLDSDTKLTMSYITFFPDTSIQAGFPSPAERAHEHRLHIDDLIVRHPEATFFVKMESEAMEGLGVFEGDILVIDRSRTPDHGSIVLATIDGEFFVRRLIRKASGWYLESANKDYEIRKVTRSFEAVIWGVVTHSVHSV